MFPSSLRYSASHEWVRLEEGLATVGITTYATDQLSDITYVELPGVGDQVEAGGVLGTIESVKAAADLDCPIDGEIVEVNESVIDDPEIIANSAYEDGWLVKIRPTDAGQIDKLMTDKEYEETINVEDPDDE